MEKKSLPEPFQFVNPPGDFLICGICQEIMEGPQVLVACGHSFCLLCVERLKETSDEDAVKCPTCREEGDPEACHVRNVALEQCINSIPIRCLHSFSHNDGAMMADSPPLDSEGCQSILTIESFSKHQSDCLFQFVGCQNRGCPVKIRKRDLGVHQGMCDFRPMACDVCGRLFTISTIQTHKARDCPKVVVSCPHGCGKSMERCLMGNHKEIMCPRRPIWCPNSDITTGARCTFKAPQNLMHAHMSTDCLFRKVPCKACGELAVLASMSFHMVGCRGTLIQCPMAPYGCTAKFRATELQAHMTESAQQHNALCMRAFCPDAPMTGPAGVSSTGFPNVVFPNLIQEPNVAANQPQPFPVFIRDLSGKSIPLNVQQDTPVEQLISNFAQKTRLPVGEMLFYFQSKKLESGKTVGEYGILRDSTLTTSCRLMSKVLQEDKVKPKS